jgi:hypothetical protein
MFATVSSGSVSLRSLIAGAVVLASATVATAQLSEGPLSPGTVVNDAVSGTSLWVNPGNAAASDDALASTAPGGTPSQFLKATSFGFSIPSPAEITGIEVTVERRSLGGTVVDAAVRIVKGGVIGATDRSAGGTWPMTDTPITYGSDSDLWGETWTPADINSAGFGAAISATDSFDTAGVDHMTITVHYSLCAATPAVGCRDADKSILIVKDKSPDSKDKLVWKWIKGASTDTAEFADPTDTAVYSLCLYAGTSAALIADALVPPSPSLWKPISTKGFKYLDKNTTQDGIKKIVLKASIVDKAKAIVLGKGDGLPTVTPPLALPVVAQLVNSDSGICWQGVYDSGDIKKNEAEKFKAKAQ